MSYGRLYCKKLNEYRASQEFLRLTDVYCCCDNSLAEWAYLNSSFQNIDIIPITFQTGYLKILSNLLPTYFCLHNLNSFLNFICSHSTVLNLTEVFLKRYLSSIDTNYSKKAKNPMAFFDVIFIRWCRGSVLAFSTQVRGFKPGRSRRIFRAKKSSARLPSEGK